MYVLVACLVPEKVLFYGKTFILSRELLATVFTFVFYQIGDALDEGVFKRRLKNGTTENRFDFSWVKTPRANGKERSRNRRRQLFNFKEAYPCCRGKISEDVNPLL
jgi:hypothetical protein